MTFTLDEPLRLALAMLVLGALIALAAVATRATRGGAVPVGLVFLLLGMLAGSEGPGGIYFDDHELAYQLGTVALVLILFDGGLNTRFDRVRGRLVPATALATVGVVLTAAGVALAARVVGLGWTEAMLLGAVVSSTDAAAVFAVLRGSRLALEERTAATIELESGLNDPMAVILTTAVTGMALSGEVAPAQLAWQVPVQLAVGVVVGIAAGLGCRALMAVVPPGIAGLFPVVTTAVACAAYGAATLLWGSGFLAVYVAGLVLGNRPLPDRAGVLRVHDFLAWLSQVGMFLALGLLVFPSQLLAIAAPALAVAGALAFVIRPAAVALTLLPFRYPARELCYVGWVGLRGAVPIILATFPVMAGVTGSIDVFNAVFFVVVVSALLQGATVRPLTRWLGLQSHAPPLPAAALEIRSVRDLHEQVACFHIDAGTAVVGLTLADIPFPEHSAVMAVVRGTDLLPARGDTRLASGDHVYVICRPEDDALLTLWFGRRLDQ